MTTNTHMRTHSHAPPTNTQGAQNNLGGMCYDGEGGPVDHERCVFMGEWGPVDRERCVFMMGRGSG